MKRLKYDNAIEIAKREISIESPTYFIADIGANHDGELGRAQDLIWRSKEAGADCAKFQHFVADKIVSRVGFSKMNDQLSHQSKWKKSVTEIYDEYHTKRDWNEELVETCLKAEIDFMTTPYDFEAVDIFAKHVSAFKIGSGDITHTKLLKYVAGIGKPILLASGASTMAETIDAVELVLSINSKLCLMQCNTNYTGNVDNFNYVNLQVLKSFAMHWPGLILGFSDHTPGHSAVLGAVALGARVIEKHFTDDTSRKGPDHSFALDTVTWRQMVDATRELEMAIGDGIKRIEANELETVVIQRRALRLKHALNAGSVIRTEDLEALRPCPAGAYSPDKLDEVIGKRLSVNKEYGEALMWTDLI